MAALDPASRLQFQVDLRAAKETQASSVVPQRATDKDSHWHTWELYCGTLGVNPTLQGIPQKLPLLEVFAHRLRSGELSASHQPISSRRVEDYLRTVGQTLAGLGSPDPRLQANGRPHAALSALFKAWKDADPPPTRVKPIPLQLLRHTVQSLVQLPLPTDPKDYTLAHAQANCLVIGYFFLLRPGEYVYSDTQRDPITLQDVSFVLNGAPINGATIDLSLLSQATAVNLLLSSQKNGTKDETISQGRTLDPLLCPVTAIMHRILHLRAHNTPPSTPVFCAFTPTSMVRVQSKHLTHLLRLSCQHLGPSLGFTPPDISARALRAGGAMALLRAKVDPVRIRLIGRWKSWTMIRYLHTTATSTHDLAAKMLHHGSFTITTHQFLPSDVANLVTAHPC